MPANGRRDLVRRLKVNTDILLFIMIIMMTFIGELRFLFYLRVFLFLHCKRTDQYQLI